MQVENLVTKETKMTEIEKMQKFLEAEPEMSEEQYDAEMKKLATEFGIKVSDLDNVLASLTNAGEAYAMKGLKFYQENK
jgi:hypothetical protein